MPERVCFRGVEAPTVHDKSNKQALTLKLYSFNIQGLGPPPSQHKDVAKQLLPRTCPGCRAAGDGDGETPVRLECG